MALCSFYKVASKDYACTVDAPNEFSGMGHNFWYGFFNTTFAEGEVQGLLPRLTFALPSPSLVAVTTIGPPLPALVRTMASARPL